MGLQKKLLHKCNKKVQSVRVPTPMFSIEEEGFISAFIATKAQNGDALTRKELLTFATRYLWKVRPDLKVAINCHSRICNSKRAARNQIQPRGPLAYKWLIGFLDRAGQLRGISYELRRPEYLDQERALITPEILEQNFCEFRELLHKLYFEHYL